MAGWAWAQYLDIVVAPGTQEGSLALAGESAASAEASAVSSGEGGQQQGLGSAWE